MTKKLFAFLLCAFAVLGAKAWTVTFSDDGKTAYLKWLVSSEGQTNNFSTEFSGETGEKLLAAETLIFETEEGGEISSMNAFQGESFAATTVDFSRATFKETDGDSKTYYKYDPDTKTTTSITKTFKNNVMSFKYFANVENAVLANVESICPATFQNNSKMATTFVIPETVKYIAKLAVENIPLSSIVIPANVEFIDDKGFQNASISALIAVTVEGYTAAAKGAFDKQTTVGQTNSDYGNYATLTFPAGHEEYFQNTNHPLSQETSVNKGMFQKWLDDHYNLSGITEESEKNGWKEFINSSSTPPTPVPEGQKVVLRTYSDTRARLVPLDFRAYIVNGVETAEVDGKTQYTLKLQQIFAIPANTGVILYGEIDKNATSFSMSTIPSWESGDGYVAPYDRFSGSVTADNNNYSLKNYLVPTVETTKIFPVYKGMTDDEWKTVLADKPSSMITYYNGTGRKDVSDRNFIMSKFQSTSLKDSKYEDYVGFFRVKANVNCGPNKAYLSLPIDVYSSAAGAEALVVKPESPEEMKFRYDVWNNSVSTGNWGQRNSSIGVLQAKSGVFEIYDETTGISSVSTDRVSDNGYYTLQGIKVVQPQKGVYVKNGKKIIK